VPRKPVVVIRSLKWQFSRIKKHDESDNWSSSKKVLAPKLKIVIRLLSQDPAEGFKIIHLKAGLQDWTPLVAFERAENEWVGGWPVGHHRIRRSL